METLIQQLKDFEQEKVQLIAKMVQAEHDYLEIVKLESKSVILDSIKGSFREVIKEYTERLEYLDKVIPLFKEVIGVLNREVS